MATAPKKPSRRLPLELYAYFGKANQDVAILAATTIFENLLRLVSSVVLTRLLDPSAFGIIGIVTSVMFFLAMISDAGFQAYVVRHVRSNDILFLNTVWTVKLLRGILLTTLTIIISVPASVLFAKPEVLLSIIVASSIFVIESISSLALLVALRDHKIKQLCAIDVSISIIQFLSSLFLAFYLRSYWALIYSMIISASMRSIFSFVFFPGLRHGIALEWPIVADLWKFSRYIAGSSLITLFLTQVDKVMFAKLLSLNEFGIYMIATMLSSAPLAFVNSYSHRFLYPHFAKSFNENAELLPSIYYSIRRRITQFYSFAAGGLIGGANVLVALLYDARYLEAGAYLQVLSLIPLFAMNNAAANEVLTASGQTQTTFLANVVRILWLLSVGPWCYFLAGTFGVVVAIGTVEMPAAIYNWLALKRRGILVLRKELELFWPALVGFAIGCGLERVVPQF